MTQKTALIVATSTAHDGNMGFRFGDESTVFNNRQRFLGTLGLKYSSCVPMQSEHGSIIKIIDDTAAKEPTLRATTLTADALITQTPNLSLLLTTADCIPLALHDPVTHTIALVHVSRHTYISNLLEDTLKILKQNIGVTIENLTAHLGPHISVDSYHFPAPLPSVHPKLAPYTHNNGMQTHINLTKATKDTLTNCGLQVANITVSPIDTYTSTEHFSHVRSTQFKIPEGRLATIVCLVTT